MAEPTLDMGGSQLEPEAPKPAPPRISTKEEVDALAPGTEFVDPTGTTRRKPYATPTNAITYRDIPDDAPFLTPEGIRYKPKYEPVDFGTQTLIDMAHGGERQIQAILAGEYKGGEVKREPFTGDYYVEKDGKLYKPDRGSILSRGAAKTVASVAPVIGGTAGAIAGGAAGIPALGVGAVPGAVIGGGIGAAGGEAFNQAALALAGYPSSIGETAKAIGTEAGMTAAGGAVGSIGGKAIDATLRGGKAILGGINKEAIGGYVGRLLGAQPDETAQAVRLAEKGVRVRPSAYLTEAPYLKKVVEEFDPAFRSQDVLKQSAEAFYTKEASALFDRLGLKAPPKMTDPVAPPATEAFGERMLSVARVRMDAADKALAEATARAHATNTEETKRALVEAEQAARQAAQDVVDAGFLSLRVDMQAAIKAAGVHENPGDLARAYYEKEVSLRRAVGARASQMYDHADTLTDIRPDSSGLLPFAQDFLANVPEGFQGRYKQLVASIEGLGEQPSFGQLHQLRTMLRQEVDERDLTATVRDGAYKRFIGKINDVLHDQMAHPELKAASTALKEADDFYGKNIAKFRSNSLRWTVEQMEAGVPADAAGVAKQFLRPNQSEEIAMVRGVGGPSLWGAVQAADTQAMLDAAKTAVPGEIDGMEFARQVVQRHKDGILTSAYDPVLANRLLQQAQAVLRMEGKLPLSAEPGDTVSTLMRRAEALAGEAKNAAAIDPVKVLNQEVRGIVRQQRDRARTDPLHFLENKTLGSIEAANRILGKPDLIMTVARQFGEHSPEFTMLRQVWTERLFQREIGETSGLSHEFSTKITPEIQALMFPGVSLADAQQLARDMHFLLPGGSMDFGGSLAAASRVLNPGGQMPFQQGFIAKHVPGADALKRLVLGKYYSTMSQALTSPTFVKFIAAGLRSGNPAMRDLAKRDFQKWMGGGGAFAGSIAGTVEDDIPPAPGAINNTPWRQLQRGRNP